MTSFTPWSIFGSREWQSLRLHYSFGHRLFINMLIQNRRSNQTTQNVPPKKYRLLPRHSDMFLRNQHDSSSRVLPCGGSYHARSILRSTCLCCTVLEYGTLMHTSEYGKVASGNGVRYSRFQLLARVDHEWSHRVYVLVCLHLPCFAAHVDARAHPLGLSRGDACACPK
jgi:hypothetical protein